MRHQESFKALFMDQLEDMYNSEQQIIKALPKLIKSAHAPQLRTALSNHLKETKHQVVRLRNVFRLMKKKPKSKTCHAMKGILEEGGELSQGKKSPVLDAGIIAAAQKVEHYEIATYGTLCSFAYYLDLDKNVISLLQENLNEEGAADKTLSRIAEGSFFMQSVNKEAVRASQRSGRALNHRRSPNAKKRTAAKRRAHAQRRTYSAKKTTRRRAA